jgi:hypothetical protein
MLKYFKESLEEVHPPYPEEVILSTMDLLKRLRTDIVEDNRSVTLFEKLDADDFFEPVMNRYIDKMMKDHILGRYFQNMKMKHMIPNKIMLFFAYSKGIINPND